MADILTQIQDELDQLLLQMNSTLHHLTHRSPVSAIPGQPSLTPLRDHNTEQANPSDAQNPNAASAGPEPQTLSRDQFLADMKELSRDLVIKEKQLEVLIDNLPGKGISEAQQMGRMRELERELEDIEDERKQAVADKERLEGLLAEKIRGVGALQ